MNRQTWVLASNNVGKLTEFSTLLAPLSVDIVAQKSLGVIDAVEDGLTFVENAIIKARHACRETGRPAIADDSGLEVDALDGAPGIYSARFAGAHGDNDANNQKLLDLMLEHTNRRARYQCVLVYMQHEHDPTPIITQGTWQGEILKAPQGDGGFGYDPIFWVESHKCSSAELPKAIKSEISHRALATQALINQLNCHIL